MSPNNQQENLDDFMYAPTPPITLTTEEFRERNLRVEIEQRIVSSEKELKSLLCNSRILERTYEKLRKSTALALKVIEEGGCEPCDLLEYFGITESNTLKQEPLMSSLYALYKDKLRKNPRFKPYEAVFVCTVDILRENDYHGIGKVADVLKDIYRRLKAAEKEYGTTY